MSETTQLGLPLLQPAQAQKHVTVNEALVRLDGLTQLVLASATVTAPPVSAGWHCLRGAGCGHRRLGRP